MLTLTHMPSNPISRALSFSIWLVDSIFFYRLNECYCDDEDMGTKRRHG